MPGSHLRTERESKLAPGPDFELSDVAGLVAELADDLVVEVPAPLDLDAAYFDAHNLVLARAGITVRHRVGHGPDTWTVKLPAGSTAAAMVRLELDVPGARNRRPREVGAAVAAHLRGRRLVPVAELHTIRSRAVIRDGDGGPVVEVAHDMVTAARGRQGLGSWEEIEVEALDPQRGPELARRIVRLLRKAGAKRVRSVPKLVRALGSPAEAPPEVVVPELASHPTVAAVVERALARSIDQILRHDPAVRIGTDPEDLHQLRVAVRRLRSDLHTFRRSFPAEEAARLRDELHWVASETNRLRDRDVLRMWLGERRELVGEPDAAMVDLLLERCDGEIADERARVRRALASSRYLTLVHDLTALLARERTTTKRGERAARARLERQVAKKWDALAARMDELGPAPDVAALHRARIAAKRARAGVEAVTPLWGPDGQRLARALAQLQDVLGAVHDAAVFEEWLRAGAEGPSAFVAGELAAQARWEGADHATHWPEAWRRARRRHAALI